LSCCSISDEILMNKQISKAIFFITLALVSSNLFSQQTLSEAGIQFKLNDSLWMRITTNKDKTPTSIIYRYKRQAIRTSNGNQVVPTISVVIESIPDSTDIMVYSAMKRVKTPLDIEEVITPDKGLLQYQNAVGYRGGYTDPTGTRHKTTLIYLINKNKGVQIIMDINLELWDEYKSEFDEIIRSIKAL
jgi:hypothetical protein